VMSKIAVPVVSDPVPAVVGTGQSESAATKGRGVFHTGNKRSECLRNRKTLSNWRVDEIHEVRIFVHREPIFYTEVNSRANVAGPVLQISRLCRVDYTSSSNTENLVMSDFSRTHVRKRTPRND
jgi:hypothetical protein